MKRRLTTAYGDFPAGTVFEISSGISDNRQFDLMANSEPVDLNDAIEYLIGKQDAPNPVGNAKFSAPTGYYFYGCTCRIANSAIASLEKNVDDVVSADTTDSFIDLAMYVGEFHPFVNKIVSVTLTNASDQMQYWLRPL